MSVAEHLHQERARQVVMQNRRRSALAASELIEQVRYSTMEWPGKTVRLERDTMQDYCHRSTSGEISVAELFHVNSKLSAHMLPGLSALRTSPAALRDEFLSRRSRALEGSGLPTLGLPRQLASLLAGLSRCAEHQLFYAIELRLLLGDLVGTYNPGLNRAQITKCLSASDRDRLLSAARLANVDDDPPTGLVLVFVVANFARNDVLYGARGYRRSLLEAGRVTDRVLHEASLFELHAQARFEFIDHEIDEVLEADGVEEGTLVVIELGGADNA